jgi:hypothetical protein
LLRDDRRRGRHHLAEPFKAGFQLLQLGAEIAGAARVGT